MGYSFDGLNKRITLTSGTTAFSTNDVYSRWKDWVRSGNAQWLPAFNGIGGESIGGGLTSGFYLFLQNGWSIIPDNVDHTLTVQGNLVRSPDDLSGEPVFQPVASSVLIIQQSSAVAIGYSTGGGTTLTPTEIWTHPNRSLTDKANFSLSTSNINDIISGIWNATTRTLTSAISDFSVADIWNYATRSLTDKTNFNLSTSERTAIAQSVETQLADDFANIDVSVTVSPQGIRDAMKLAPSPGTPADGSIDAVLEVVKDQAEIAAKVNQI